MASIDILVRCGEKSSSFVGKTTRSSLSTAIIARLSTDTVPEMSWEKGTSLQSALPRTPSMNQLCRQISLICLGATNTGSNKSLTAIFTISQCVVERRFLFLYTVAITKEFPTSASSARMLYDKVLKTLSVSLSLFCEQP